MSRRSIGSLLGLLFSLATMAQAQSWDTVTPVPTDRVPAQVLPLVLPNHNTALLDDGSVVSANPLYSHGNPFITDTCDVEARTESGALVWRRSFGQPNSLSQGAYCVRLGLDGSQGLWLRTSDGLIHRFAGDGAADGASPVNVGGIGTFADFAPNPHGSGAYLLIAPATVVAIDKNEVPLWFWTDPDKTHTFQKIALGSIDGNVYLAGRTVPPAGSGAAGGLLLASVSASGDPRSIVPHAEFVAPTLLAFVPALSGAFYLADFVPNGDGTQQLALQRIAPDGSVQWNRTVIASIDSPAACSLCLPDCGLTLSLEGDALLYASPTQNSVAGFFRYDAAGNLLVAHATATNAVTALLALDTGETVLGGAGTDGGLLLDRDGNAVPPPQIPTVSASPSPSFAAIGTDGSTYLLASGTAHATLSKVAADGTIAWSESLGAFAQGEAISTGGDRVCVQGRVDPGSGASSLECFDATRGDKLWSSATFVYPWRVLNDGTVIGFTGTSAAPFHVAFDRSGTLAHRLALPAAAPLAGSMTPGGTLAYFSANYSHLLAFDPNGSALYAAAVPAQFASINLSAQPPTLTLFDDGSAAVSVQPFDTSKTSYLWALDAHGTTRWVQAFAQGSAGHALAASADTVYVVAGSTDPNNPRPLDRIQARALADGSVRWQTAAPIPLSVTLMKIDAASGRALLITADERRFGLVTLDPATGAVLRARYLPCAGDDCGWLMFDPGDNAALALNADGTLRTAATVSDGDGQHNDAFALHAAAATPAPIRVDQAGIDGAWYPSYESGQGFWIDYVASGNYLQMPWFTYAPAQSPTPLDPAQLVWYSLQASVPSGATGVDLAIGLSAPGVFNSGQLGLTQIGSAHLSFTDCNSATLMYQFSGGYDGNAGGLLSLTRLTPSTSDCQLADGSTTPAQLANVPAQGFDARSSGTWYDPATSGQGLQLTIMPPATGFTGAVFGGWFTFDPANAANDAQHLQWFTLQGDLAGGVDGRVVLQIGETLGGSFDGAPTHDTHQVGLATLTLTACDKATLDYQFWQEATAHAFAGLTGRETLSKIGGCAP